MTTSQARDLPNGIGKEGYMIHTNPWVCNHDCLSTTL